MPHSLKRPQEDLQEEEMLKYSWRAFRVDSTDMWLSSSAPFWRPFNFYCLKALSSQPWGVSGESGNVSRNRPTALQSLTRREGSSGEPELVASRADTTCSFSCR